MPTLLAVVVALASAVLSKPIAASPADIIPWQDGLTRRWDISATANDEIWSNAVCKGGQFVEAFPGSDEEAGKIFKSTASPPTMRNQWQGDLKDDLSKWGWEETNPHAEHFCDFETFWQYNTPYNALGLNKKPKFLGFPKRPSPDGGDNVCYEFWHGDKSLNDDHEKRYVEQEYKVNGQEYSKTGAYHKVAINQVGGVVTAQYRLSPAHAAEDNWGWKPHGTELPALRTSADLLWGFWYRDNPDIRNIRYFWAQNVQNIQTSRIVASVLKMRGKELTGWPGATFDMDTDEGLALLGSPNAISFGYFLISHKKELGNKKITKARIFFGNENSKSPMDKRHPDMLFYVEDVPEETGNNPEGQEGNQPFPLCNVAHKLPSWTPSTSPSRLKI
ncbi:hypothetical protein P171DRAFT_180271 [Karstenula rhodostoma CBS 690.94]|uniref:DAPG hydrolase PhiG domain-containing protein n=1 Tax=Karstenula rhodostoma CBS 690.94 TaxID=1392251 RepID=A0A9P4U3W7_9PLEO|nr:hypothetical protein P171DRAFT_180271 [Karstenula rhodostoma CBS 690.94]